VSRLNFHGAHRFPGGFSLDVAFDTSAQVTGLIGPSGAGKTSVLYMIAGLLRPRSGWIEWGGQTWLDTRRGIHLPPERRHVGFVFQDHLLFPHLSVQRNLMYGRRRRRGRSSAIEDARVIEVLELGDLLVRYPRNLSGGEKQRVALGRSLLSAPQLLLMDEPLAALDEALKDRVLTYFQRVADQWHIPTIYVSHNPGELRRLADRVIVLEQGRVTQCGPTEEVLPANDSSLSDVDPPLGGLSPFGAPSS
jgi:molybdate transport system ATP-binding protein